MPAKKATSISNLCGGRFRQLPTAETMLPTTTKEPIRFQVVVDGENLYDGEVPAWKWEETFDLTSLEFSDKTMIELRSETFVPKGVMDEGLNTDTRVLGVQVQGVMLSRDD
jgi:hypothetical protein